MRKKVMAFNDRVNAWLMERLKGVWLEPIFLGVFAVMTVLSVLGGFYLEKKNLFYSAAIWALAALMCLRRIQRIRRQEKQEQNDRKTEEK